MVLTIVDIHMDVKKWECFNCGWESYIVEVEKDIRECRNCLTVYRYNKKQRLWKVLREGV